MGLRKSFTKRQVRLPIGDIPAFFRGGLGGNVESDSDREFGEAVTALVALTGRPENDPVLRVVLAQLEDAKPSLLSEACTFGRCIPDGQPDGIDEWDDDALASSS